MASSDNQARQMNVSFPPSTYQALEELASVKGGSIADALRDAIAFSQWAKEVQEHGGKILAEQDGKISEVRKF